MIVTRDMGQDVPPEAQDTESNEYQQWLESQLNRVFFSKKAICQIFDKDLNLIGETLSIEYAI